MNSVIAYACLVTVYVLCLYMHVFQRFMFSYFLINEQTFELFARSSGCVCVYSTPCAQLCQILPCIYTCTFPVVDLIQLWICICYVFLLFHNNLYRTMHKQYLLFTILRSYHRKMSTTTPGSKNAMIDNRVNCF